MFNRRFAVGLSVIAIIVGACSSAATPSPAATAAAPTAAAPTAAAGCTVGVSWNNYQEERWAKWDEPAIKAALAAGGATYVSNDAKSSAETQASNVENLISQGAKVIIILAQDGTAIKPSVAKAIAAGVPVIAYDRLIEDPTALYITFDNVLVGKLQAEALLKVKDAGNFVVIKGNKADANADFLRDGMVQAGVPAVGQSTDKLKNVGETYTDNWDPANAQKEMEQFLTANGNKIDIAFVENDGMAGGAIAALKAVGLAGKVPVSGQDGDAAALNRVALGTQTVDVWKDARLLGTAAGEAAAQLCANKDIKSVKGVAAFKSPGGNDMTSILLTPQPITKDNLNVVLDAKWIDQATLCQGVPAGSVAACGGSAQATPAAAGCTVGVSWNNYQEERWAKWDEPAIKAALAAGGATYVSNDAKSSAETQASNVENLISQGAKVIIILAQDGTAIKPSVAKAIAAGVPVIAYDRLIEDPTALYITFDNVLVGKLQAEALLKVKDAGNFVVIKGNKADANADFLRDGMVQAGVPAVGQSTDKLKNVGETYTDNWDPANAQKEMEQFLTANGNKIDIAFVENDGMAGGAIAALKAVGLAGKVPVSGQDGDAAALNRVALGTQTVDVWKDARLLGTAAGEAAAQLCANKDIKSVKGVGAFKSPGGNDMTSILLTPQPITKDNLNVVLDAKWIDKATLCQGVPAGSVAACN